MQDSQDAGSRGHGISLLLPSRDQAHAIPSVCAEDVSLCVSYSGKWVIAHCLEPAETSVTTEPTKSHRSCQRVRLFDDYSQSLEFHGTNRLIWLAVAVSTADTPLLDVLVSLAEDGLQICFLNDLSQWESLGSKSASSSLASSLPYPCLRRFVDAARGLVTVKHDVWSTVCQCGRKQGACAPSSIHNVPGSASNFMCQLSCGTICELLVTIAGIHQLHVWRSVRARLTESTSTHSAESLKVNDSASLRRILSCGTLEGVSDRGPVVLCPLASNSANAVLIQLTRVISRNTSGALQSMRGYSVLGSAAVHLNVRTMECRTGPISCDAGRSISSCGIRFAWVGGLFGENGVMINLPGQGNLEDPAVLIHRQQYSCKAESVNSADISVSFGEGMAVVSCGAEGSSNKLFALLNESPPLTCTVGGKGMPWCGNAYQNASVRSVALHQFRWREQSDKRLEVLFVLNSSEDRDGAARQEVFSVETDQSAVSSCHKTIIGHFQWKEQQLLQFVRQIPFHLRLEVYQRTVAWYCFTRDHSSISRLSNVLGTSHLLIQDQSNFRVLFKFFKYCDCLLRSIRRSPDFKSSQKLCSKFVSATATNLCSQLHRLCNLHTEEDFQNLRLSLFELAVDSGKLTELKPILNEKSVTQVSQSKVTPSSGDLQGNAGFLSDSSASESAHISGSEDRSIDTTLTSDSLILSALRTGQMMAALHELQKRFQSHRENLARSSNISATDALLFSDHLVYMDGTDRTDKGRSSSLVLGSDYFCRAVVVLLLNYLSTSQIDSYKALAQHCKIVGSRSLESYLLEISRSSQMKQATIRNSETVSAVDGSDFFGDYGEILKNLDLLMSIELENENLALIPSFQRMDCSPTLSNVHSATSFVSGYDLRQASHASFSHLKVVLNPRYQSSKVPLNVGIIEGGHVLQTAMDQMLERISSASQTLSSDAVLNEEGLQFANSEHASSPGQRVLDELFEAAELAFNHFDKQSALAFQKKLAHWGILILHSDNGSNNAAEFAREMLRLEIAMKPTRRVSELIPDRLFYRHKKLLLTSIDFAAPFGGHGFVHSWLLHAACESRCIGLALDWIAAYNLHDHFDKFSFGTVDPMGKEWIQAVFALAKYKAQAATSTDIDHILAFVSRQQDFQLLSYVSAPSSQVEQHLSNPSLVTKAGEVNSGHSSGISLLERIIPHMSMAHSTNIQSTECIHDQTGFQQTSLKIFETLVQAHVPFLSPFRKSAKNASNPGLVDLSSGEEEGFPRTFQLEIADAAHMISQGRPALSLVILQQCCKDFEEQASRQMALKCVVDSLVEHCNSPFHRECCKAVAHAYGIDTEAMDVVGGAATVLTTFLEQSVSIVKDAILNDDAEAAEAVARLIATAAEQESRKRKISLHLTSTWTMCTRWCRCTAVSPPLRIFSAWFDKGLFGLALQQADLCDMEYLNIREALSNSSCPASIKSYLSAFLTHMHSSEVCEQQAVSTSSHDALGPDAFARDTPSPIAMSTQTRRKSSISLSRQSSPSFGQINRRYSTSPSQNPSSPAIASMESVSGADDAQKAFYALRKFGQSPDAAQLMRGAARTLGCPLIAVLSTAFSDGTSTLAWLAWLQSCLQHAGVSQQAVQDPDDCSDAAIFDAIIIALSEVSLTLRRPLWALQSIVLFTQPSPLPLFFRCLHDCLGNRFGGAAHRLFQFVRSFDDWKGQLHTMQSSRQIVGQCLSLSPELVGKVASTIADAACAQSVHGWWRNRWVQCCQTSKLPCQSAGIAHSLRLLYSAGESSYNSIETLNMLAENSQNSEYISWLDSLILPRDLCSPEHLTKTIDSLLHFSKYELAFDVAAMHGSVDDTQKTHLKAVKYLLSKSYSAMPLLQDERFRRTLWNDCISLLSEAASAAGSGSLVVEGPKLLVRLASGSHMSDNPGEIQGLELRAEESLLLLQAARRLVSMSNPQQEESLAIDSNVFSLTEKSAIFSTQRNRKMISVLMDACLKGFEVSTAFQEDRDSSAEKKLTILSSDDEISIREFGEWLLSRMDLTSAAHLQQFCSRFSSTTSPKVPFFLVDVELARTVQALALSSMSKTPIPPEYASFCVDFVKEHSITIPNNLRRILHHAMRQTPNNTDGVQSSAFSSPSQGTEGSRNQNDSLDNLNASQAASSFSGLQMSASVNPSMLRVLAQVATGGAEKCIKQLIFILEAALALRQPFSVCYSMDHDHLLREVLQLGPAKHSLASDICQQLEIPSESSSFHAAECFAVSIISAMGQAMLQNTNGVEASDSNVGVTNSHSASMLGIRQIDDVQAVLRSDNFRPSMHKFMPSETISQTETSQLLAKLQLNGAGFHMSSVWTLRQLAQYCQVSGSPIHIGNEVLDICSRHWPSSKLSLAVDAELVLLAHMCFVTKLDSDGLSRVRAMLKPRIPILVSSQCWDVLGRLWSGLRGLGSLQDILHLLKQHDRFEVVLRKIGDKDQFHDTCQSLLSFLDCYHPDDEACRQLVLYNFNSLRSIGSDIFEKAIRRSKLLLVGKHLCTKSPFQIRVQLCELAQQCVESAQYLIGADCPGLAEKALSMGCLFVTQAKWPNIQLLNLRNVKEVNAVLESIASFQDALSVARAYGVAANTSTWQRPLFHQAVENGNNAYLHEFMNTLPAPDSLFFSLANRLKRSTRSANSISSFRKVLEATGDLSLRAKLAATVGFYPDVLMQCQASLGTIQVDEHDWGVE